MSATETEALRTLGSSQTCCADEPFSVAMPPPATKDVIEDELTTWMRTDDSA
jgi:hypothetical protein